MYDNLMRSCFTATVRVRHQPPYHLGHYENSESRTLHLRRNRLLSEPIFLLSCADAALKLSRDACWSLLEPVGACWSLLVGFRRSSAESEPTQVLSGNWQTG